MTLSFVPLSICLCIYLWLTPSRILCQENSPIGLSQDLASDYVQGIYAKSEKIKHKIDRHTSVSLIRLKKLEERLISKVSRGDSSSAKRLSKTVTLQYEDLNRQLAGTQSAVLYESVLDTLSTSLKFLKISKSLQPVVTSKLDAASTSLDALNKSLRQTEVVKNFLRQRQEIVKDYLSHTHLVGELKKVNNYAGYYTQQINEYKTILNDHRKAEKKALQLLSKSTVFQKFMQKNSILATLFRLPSDAGSAVAAVNIEGLQTRDQVSQILQQQLGASASQGLQHIQGSIQDAQQHLNILKSKLTEYGRNSNGENGMPNSKINELKTKSLFKRLVYGINVQSQRASNYFPVTSEIAASIGYKLTSKNVAGIAVSYRLGAGNDFRHIHFTNEALGFRSFFDYQLKSTWYASGGFEMNYRNAFDRIEELKIFNAWQQSGLLGFSKIIPIKNKIFKETKLQLLWDFLSYRHVPREQPLKFRVGYNF